MGFIASLLGIGNTGGQWQAATGNNMTQGGFGQYQEQLAKQDAFTAAAMGQNGLANQSNVLAQQQALAGQLGAEAQGGGPNPAAAQLAQATGQNIAAQGALAAGQRGAGANAGLIQRQAAQQGAGLQQQAVGQAATMRANQQLAAQQQLMGQQGAMANLTGQQVANAQGAIGQGAGMTLQNQSQQLGALAQQNTANAGIQTQNAKGQQGLLGGVMGGIGAAMGLAGGGMVPVMPAHYADGGEVEGPRSSIGKYLGGFGSMGADESGANALQSGMAGLMGGIGSRIRGSAGGAESMPGSAPSLGVSTALPMPSAAGIPGVAPAVPQIPNLMPSGGGAGLIAGATPGLARGGKVPAMLSPGEKYLPPKDAKKVAAGKESPMRGKTVPGKAKVPGDSLKNDTVPAELETGGVVIPREALESKEKARKFVEAVMARQGMKRKKNAA